MGENTRKNRRAKVLSMTVRYRSATLGEFIEHHSYDVSKGGMFIKTPSPFPAGTLLKFEVKIADEQRVMQGVGRVVWKRDEDGPGEDDPAGMGIKFIKIDDASRTVIDRLLDERGAGGEGAFEKSPESKQKMFPDPSKVDQPAPEDQTVMKPASELLQDALKKTGREEEAPKSEKKADSGFESVKEKPTSLSPPAPEKEEEKDEEPPRSRKEVSRSSSQGAGSSSGPRSSREDEEGSGGRAIISLFVAVLVAGGIYIATKSGGEPEPEPAPAATPSTSTPEILPIEEEPVAEEPEVDEPIEEEAVEEIPEEEEAPEPVADVKPIVAPAPKPAPAPAPAPKPAPKPAPAPAPKPAPAPAPKPALAPQPAPAPKPAPAPAPAPAPGPVVAPTPPPPVVTPTPAPAPAPPPVVPAPAPAPVPSE